MASASGSGEPPKKLMKLSGKDEEVNQSGKDVKKEGKDKDNEVQMLAAELSKMKEDDTWSKDILTGAFFKLRDSVEALGGERVEAPQDWTLKNLVLKVHTLAEEIEKKVPMSEDSGDDRSGCSGSDSDDVSGSDDDNAGGKM